MRAIIMKHKPKDAHIFKLKLIKILNQSIELSEPKIDSNIKNFRYFFNKPFFVCEIMTQISCHS